MRVPMSDFDADRYAERAADATGLDDFGDDSWRAGLERLLASLDSEAALNDLGRTIVDGEIVTYLTNRLGVIAERRAHPEIARGTVAPPIVASAVETATKPLRGVRHVFEEEEEVHFSLKRSRKVTVHTISKGEKAPTGKNNTEAGRARNRRVDITIHN